MNPELKVIIFEEKNIIKRLSALLDDQYEYIIDKDVIKMDKIVGELENEAKNLAKIEIQRRKIMGKDASLQELVENSQDKQVKEAYNEIKKELKLVEMQKETNKILLKQRLFFTKKILNSINPSKRVQTYNAYGQVNK